MQKHKPYELVRAQSGSPYMDAAYCKYYPKVPYVAVFEEYPAEHTKVVVFRKVDAVDTIQLTNRNICKLIAHKPDGTSQLIGHYKPVSTVTTEKQATEAVTKHIQSCGFLQRTLGGE